MADSLTLLLNAFFKGLILLGLAETVLLIWKNASAAMRHTIRLVAVISVLLIPIAEMFTPAAHAPVWNLGTERIAGNQIRLTVQIAPETRSIVQVNAPRSTQSQDLSFASKVELNDSWPGIAALLWVIGAAASLLPLLIGMIERRRLATASTESGDPEWTRILSAVREEWIIRRNVKVLHSAEARIPITWGWIAPAILVPPCAALWSEERKRLIIAHELAHIKRWDCLVQVLVQLICAFFWFNPLIWRTARLMRLDREQACDDLVLNGAAKPTSYALHLVEIARGLATSAFATGIPIARPSQLEVRVRAILDNSRSRTALTRKAQLAVLGVASILVITAAGQKSETDHAGNTAELRRKQLLKLQDFSARKEKHAEALLAETKEEFFPEFRTFFQAAKNGDWQTVTNLYVDFRSRHSQYSGTRGDLPHTPYWQTLLETCLAYTDVTWGEPQHVQLATDGFLESIPAGAIYFGGTDPGRGLPTAFCADHAEGKPFFVLTQNALADSTYLKYLQSTLGAKIYVPKEEDAKKAFSDYVKDATERHRTGKLKPGETVTVNEETHQTSVSGLVSVMEINARLARVIFDKNPDRTFYIEESFPLDWMYPYLSPAGQIMKINRQALPSLSEEIIREDAAYWDKRVRGFLGRSIDARMSMKDFLSGMEEIWVQHKLPAKADAHFFSNDWAQRAFSKWRSGIVGLYVWRARSATNPAEIQRMRNAAELALRQAYALRPASPDVVRKYTDFLANTDRSSDASALAEMSVRIDPDNRELRKESARQNSF